MNGGNEKVHNNHHCVHNRLYTGDTDRAMVFGVRETD